MWERKLHRVLLGMGWRIVESGPGTHVHDESGSAMVVYVDDLLLVAGEAESDMIWERLGSEVDFKDPPPLSVSTWGRSISCRNSVRCRP